MAEKDKNKIGDVIRIIDNRTLIINVGRSSLQIGDKIKVYESLETLYDLDGSEIGAFEYTKDTLEVIEVDENYSICQKQKSKITSFSDMAISPLLSMQKTEYIPLNVDKDEVKPLKEKDVVIHVGDPVKMA